jgi:Flp pilus assembly protein TadB
MARRSTLRASDADRDGVVERLREAAGEGRLAAHELEQRIAAALGARTYGELDATISDLPSPQAPSRRRTTAGRAVSTVRAHPALLLVAIPVVMVVVAAMIAVTMVWAAVTVLALLLGHHRRMMYRGRPPRMMGPWRYSSHPARRNWS